MDELTEFVLSVVDEAQKDRQSLEPIWHEVEQSYLVRPYIDTSLGMSTAYPFAGTHQNGIDNHSILKDSETHQQIITLAAMTVLGLFPDSRFIQAEMVGDEDVFKANIVSRLSEHTWRLPGHFWAIVEWVVDIYTYGTGMLEGEWGYREEPRNLRTVEQDETGQMISSSSMQMIPVYDDPRFRALHIRDFFHDTGATSMVDAKFGCKRFRVAAGEAMLRAASGMYDKAAVKRAIDGRGNDDARNSLDKPFSESDQIGHDRKSHPDYMEMIGYEFVGETPFNSHDGITRRIITVVGGETVRNDPWPRRLPFFDGRIIPRRGSFFGFSPAEGIRYDQDFVDILKMMIADSVVMSTHPPHIYNTNAEIDQRQLRRWSPRVPIGVNGPIGDAIGTAPYNPPLGNSVEIQNQSKAHMRENTGVLGAVQGLGLGSKRFSATEASETFSAARDRPEFFATVLEREYLPPPARFALELYQEFLEEGTDDLQRRVGSTEVPVDVSTILTDFDVRFVGSRQLGTLNERVSASREIFQAAAGNPLLNQLMPWVHFLREWFRDIGQPEIAAQIGDPQLVKLNLMLQQFSGPGAALGIANGNGTSEAGPPVGQIPAQGIGRQSFV